MIGILFFCVVSVNGVSTESLKIVEMEGFPSSRDFVDKHLGSVNPLRMAAAAEDSPAFILWEDNDYLKSLKGPSKQSRTTNTEYFRTGGPMDYFITGLYYEDGVFADFVEKYTKSDLTIATTLPSHLRKDVLLPCSIQCPDFWNERLIDAFLWMSNEKMLTKMHSDTGGNFICTYRGELKFTILDNLAWRKMPPKIEDNTILQIMPQKHMISAGKLYDVKVPKGDCIYIPPNTGYFVQSSSDTMAVSILFDSVVPESINPASCNRKCNTDLTLNSVQFRQYHIIEDEVKSTKDYVMSLRNQGAESPLHYLEERLKSLAQFDFSNSRAGDIVRTVAKMTIELVDKDNSGDIDESEYFGMTKIDWLKFGKKLSELMSVLEYYNSNPGTHPHSEL